MLIKDAVAVVTGGASGLGLATTKALLDEGAKVVILDLPSSKGDEVAKELGDAVRFAPADVTDEEAVTKAFDLAETLGTVRIVVNCAGTGSVGPMSSPDASCTKVRSPISATVRPPVRSCDSAAPMAADTVPSIPATPRFDRTVTPGVANPARATSRTGLDAPRTSWSPGRTAAATAAATCSPVVSGCAAS